MYFDFTSIQGYFPAALIHSRNFSSVLFGCLLVAHQKKHVCKYCVRFNRIFCTLKLKLGSYQQKYLVIHKFGNDIINSLVGLIYLD